MNKRERQKLLDRLREMFRVRKSRIPSGREYSEEEISSMINEAFKGIQVFSEKRQLWVEEVVNTWSEHSDEAPNIREIRKTLISLERQVKTGLSENMFSDLECLIWYFAAKFYIEEKATVADD